MNQPHPATLRSLLTSAPAAIRRRLLHSLRADQGSAPAESPAAATPWQVYNEHVERSVASYADRQQAMAQAIGGNFIPFGSVMRSLLRSEGLKPNQTLVDIGCGSGRLPFGIKDYLTGKLIGVDVVPALVDHARTLVGRPDWTFSVGTGLSIPADDTSVDFVTAFSVFTHLRHEQSYAYLRDAKRVLRKGGKIIFSFLQFAVPCHWDVFEANLGKLNDFQHLNQFMSVDAIETWAQHLGLRVQSIAAGDAPHIVLEEPVTLDDGRVFAKEGCLGQSVCVLVKD